MLDAGGASTTSSTLYKGVSDHVCCMEASLASMRWCDTWVLDKFLLRAGGVQQGGHEQMSLLPAH
jgi:hypothetical protein